MTRIRRYWLDSAIVVLIFVALFIGITHRASRFISSTVDSETGAMPTSPMLSPYVQRRALFSVDTVAAGPVSKTYGGMGRVMFSARKGDVVSITGWAVDPAAQGPASAVIFQVGRSERINAQYGNIRPDVARVLGVPGYASSGFSALIPTAHLKTGRQDVSLIIVDAKRTGDFVERDQVELHLH